MTAIFSNPTVDVGPLIGGVLLRPEWSNARIFAVVAVPALVSASMVGLMGVFRPDRGAPLRAG